MKSSSSTTTSSLDFTEMTALQKWELNKCAVDLAITFKDELSSLHLISKEATAKLIRKAVEAKPREIDNIGTLIISTLKMSAGEINYKLQIPHHYGLNKKPRRYTAFEAVTSGLMNINRLANASEKYKNFAEEYLAPETSKKDIPVLVIECVNSLFHKKTQEQLQKMTEELASLRGKKPSISMSGTDSCDSSENQPVCGAYTEAWQEAKNSSKNKSP